MPEPLAYFLTWTCYGTWLPGDARRWVDKHDSGPEIAYKPPDPQRLDRAAALMEESPAILSSEYRGLVERAMRETCQYRGWFIHQLNVRSNHVHVVVTAPNTRPERAMQAFKANATRALRSAASRKHWWTKSGSTRYLNNQQSLHAAIRYVRDQ